MAVQTLFLPAGQTLTVTADASSSGYVYRLGNPGSGTQYSLTPVGPAATQTFGPFAQDRTYAIDSEAGAMTYTAAVADFSTDDTDFEGVAATLATIPSGESYTIGANSQIAIFGTFTVIGTLTVKGQMRVGAWPF